MSLQDAITAWRAGMVVDPYQRPTAPQPLKPRMEPGQPTDEEILAEIFGPGGLDGNSDLPGLQWKTLPDGRVVAFDPVTGDATPIDLPQQKSSPFAGLIQDIWGSMVEKRLKDQFFPSESRGGSGIGWAQLAESQKNNKFQRMLEYLQLIETQRALGDQSVQQAFEDLAAVAPDLAGGQEFRGGYGPYGGGTLLEMMQGGPGIAKRSAPVPAVLPTPQQPDYSRIEKLLGPLV